MLDSVGGAPTARRNEDAEVANYGGNALGVGEFARSAAAMSARYNCLTVGLNQIREDMAGYNRHMVPGGHAWLHAVALRLQLKKGKGKKHLKINGEEYQIGYEVVAKVVKNGLGAPGRVASYWFMNVPTEEYGFGVDRVEECVRLGLITEVIQRRGGWYSHPELPGKDHQVLGQDKLLDAVREDPSLRVKISTDITDRLKSGNYGAQVAPMSDPDLPVEQSGFPKLLMGDE
jgi:hypothetical protein